MSEQNDFLFETELMQRWKCTKRYLQWLRSKHRETGKGLPFFRTGTEYKYRIDDVRAYEAALAQASSRKDGDATDE